MSETQPAPEWQQRETDWIREHQREAARDYIEAEREEETAEAQRFADGAGAEYHLDATLIPTDKHYRSLVLALKKASVSPDVDPTVIPGLVMELRRIDGAPHN